MSIQAVRRLDVRSSVLDVQEKQMIDLIATRIPKEQGLTSIASGRTLILLWQKQSVQVD
jgi:hypothetical protein